MAETRSDSRGVKSALLYILRILEEETDSENTMNALEIQERLEDRYEMKINIKTVRSYLAILKDDEETPVGCTQIQNDSEESDVTHRCYEWHCTKDPLLDHSEYLYVAAGIASSSKISRNKKKRLIEKMKPYCDGPTPPSLQSLYNSSFATEIVNEQFFENIELIDNAIRKKTCLRFHLCAHYPDGTLNYEEDERPYTVEPEFIAVWDGRYHLVARYYGKSKRFHFRVDMIKGMEIAVDEKGNSLKFDKRNECREDIQLYVDRHPFAYGEPTRKITMKVKDDSRVKFHLFDTFGPKVTFSEYKGEEGYLTASIYANTIPVKAWALGRADEVEILTPESLRNELLDAAKAAAKLYRA